MHGFYVAKKISFFPVITKKISFKMDELVTDLTLALERTDDPQSSKSDTTIGTKDSPSSTPVRRRKKRRGRKRRSDFPLSKDLAILSEDSNDSVEEALKDYIENITVCHSDSDEDSALVSSKRLSMLYRLASQSDPFPFPENDPMNESNIGLPTKRGNKKMKRSKITSSGSTFQNNSDFSTNGKSKVPRWSRKRKLSSRITGNAIGETWTRRSKYEEGTACVMDNGKSLNDPVLTNDISRNPKSGNVHVNILSDNSRSANQSSLAAAAGVTMDPHDEVMVGSDSEYSSGNESEGFFTNDEGRLGDDEGEESTFEHDPSIPSVIPWWETETEEMEVEQKFNNIVNGVMEAYGIPPESKARGGGLQARLDSIKSMYEINYMKSLVEANKSINKFLHDPSKSELSIQLTSRNEREKIYQLASLYSLHCQTENLVGSRIILIKTRNTCKADKKALNNLLGKYGKRKGLPAVEVKRPRRMAQRAEGPVGPVGQFASAIPKDNIGNQMLRSMGWVPGTGLGPDKSGIVEPIAATLRPRKLGLGHSWTSSK